MDAKVDCTTPPPSKSKKHGSSLDATPPAKKTPKTTPTHVPDYGGDMHVVTKPKTAKTGTAKEYGESGTSLITTKPAATVLPESAEHSHLTEMKGLILGLYTRLSLVETNIVHAVQGSDKKQIEAPPISTVSTLSSEAVPFSASSPFDLAEYLNMDTNGSEVSYSSVFLCLTIVEHHFNRLRSGSLEGSCHWIIKVIEVQG